MTNGTLGIAVWKQDVAYHAYDKKRDTLEAYLVPRHLKNSDEVRIQILPLSEFETPVNCKTVRVIDLQ